MLRMAVALLAAALTAAQAPPAAAAAPGAPTRIERLAVDVERAEALRAIKRIQRAYAQYSEFGLWDEMTVLFADQAEFIDPKGATRGRAAIGARLRQQFGEGRQGLAPGGLHIQMPLSPVVTLSADGRTAKGRWHEVSMLGGYGAGADWDGGILENEYVKERGVWKIARHHYYPQFRGAYVDGWRNAEPGLKLVPYHYTSQQPGEPVPAAPAGARVAPADLAALERRIAAMADEDAIRNLQNAYGYYLDRKMWDDMVELFAVDGSMRIEGLGTYLGQKGVRRALERLGPAGLRHGEMFDHPQVGTIVTVAPGGREAVARGMELGLTGRNNEKGYWAETIFENRYVKQGGVWRIREVRLFPRMKTDYDMGWAKSQVTDPAPPAALAPDRPAAGGSWRRETAIPAFSYANPATGRPVRYPAGASVVAAGRAPAAAPAPRPAGSQEARLTEAELGVKRAVAYDAAENLASAFGYYIDEFQWADMAQLFAVKGTRESPGVGIYATRERIRLLAQTRYPNPRGADSIPIHMRIQPVVHVSPDAKTARIRTRLFQFNSNLTRPGSLTAGMYEDELVFEEGRWEFLNLEIDHIWRSPGYKAGWIRVPENNGQGPTPVTGAVANLRPDMPLRGEPVAIFPTIQKMWFHYDNPVSGRPAPARTPKPFADKQPAFLPGQRGAAGAD